MTTVNLQNASQVPAQQITVLLVEDSVLIRDSLIDLIESDMRCTVSMATDSELMAKQALAEGEYDVAIIDLELREGSGQGVLRFLQIQPKPPLRIVLTNCVECRIREECMALGADHFFDKSSQFEDVSRAIDHYRAH